MVSYILALSHHICPSASVRFPFALVKPSLGFLRQIRSYLQTIFKTFFRSELAIAAVRAPSSFATPPQCVPFRPRVL